jgi:alpha-D-xyloside xylohydrolase
MLEEELGRGQAIVFARSATTGGQQFPVHWGGDNTATFISMAETLRGGLSLGLSGFGFWSHDISGFEQTAPPEVYKRWCAFGLLSSHSRLHGSSSYRVPWLFDEEAVDVLRIFTRLKCLLMPYLFSTAIDAHKMGVPMLRAMMLEFPGDPGCEMLDRQYMLGDSLLVAPVFSLDGEVIYYVPDGVWTNILSAETVTGPGWQRETHGYMSLPILARPNTVLPIGRHDDKPDYEYGDGVLLQVYQLDDGIHKEISIPTQEGSVDRTFVVERSGNEIMIMADGVQKPWEALLVGIDADANVENGVPTITNQGVRVKPIAPANTVKVQLPT